MRDYYQEIVYPIEQYCYDWLQGEEQSCEGCKYFNEEGDSIENPACTKAAVINLKMSELIAEKSNEAWDSYRKMIAEWEKLNKENKEMKEGIRKLSAAYLAQCYGGKKADADFWKEVENVCGRVDEKKV